MSPNRVAPAMLCIHIIDNMGAAAGSSLTVSPALAGQICDLIKGNMIFENCHSSYSEEDMAHLVRNKLPALINQRLENGILVYLTDRTGSLYGCGMVEKKGARHEAKTLHVHHQVRRRGYAHLICDAREKVLRNHNIFAVYTESLKFPNTLRFHKSRGFLPFDDGKSRKYSVLMKKELV